MSRWFRFYDETLDDPKVLRLPDNLYRAWVGLLCIASKNNGTIPSFDDVAIMLRSDVSSVENIINELIERKLIDRQRNGDLTPHNWRKRQYKSDVSTDRVKQFRKRQRNVSETPPETEQKQIQKVDTEKKESRAVAKATRTPDSPEFEEFWKAYPKREGPNPKAEARKAFRVLVAAGADAQSIIAAVKRFAVAERASIGTRFLPHASTWLRGQRFEDYQQQPAPTGPLQAPIGLPSDEELRKKYGQHHSVPPETKAASGNGIGADHVEELRREGAEIRPGFRSF